MDTAISPLPDDIEALKALVLAATRKADLATQRAADAEARLANAQAQASATEAMIAHLKLQIAKLDASKNLWCVAARTDSMAFALSGGGDGRTARFL